MSKAFLQDLVAEYCKINSVKKKDFAEKIGVSPVKLSHWLAGRARLPISVLEKIEVMIHTDNE